MQAVQPVPIVLQKLDITDVRTHRYWYMCTVSITASVDKAVEVS